MKQSFYSNGKLLITGEYAVLDGALALALPTKFGQSLHLNTIDKGSEIDWKSFDADNGIWFKATITTSTMLVLDSNDFSVAKMLVKILKETKKLNPSFLSQPCTYQIETKLTFNRFWGLGSSSTLINNIANWANVNPYTLLQHTFGGSGYDLACAKHNSPIVYQRADDGPKIEEISFDPLFKDSLYFVYLNRKQNSREAIANYKKQQFDKATLITTISEITKNSMTSDNLLQFEEQLKKHEVLLAKTLGLPTIQSQLFSDFPGVVKSLGGWGGDFVLATGNEKTPDYFKAKGFDIVIPYRDMIL